MHDWRIKIVGGQRTVEKSEDKDRRRVAALALTIREQLRGV